MPFNWRKLHDVNQEDNNNRRWRAELTVLVQEDEAMREDAQRVCQTNLLALAWVLGYCKIDEHIHHDAINFFLRKDPNLSLEEWLKEAQSHYQRRASLLLPRGVYKTTLSLANCVQLIICWPMTIAIMIMSGRRELAWDIVAQVASFFVHKHGRAPTLFQAIFPHLCVTKEPDSGEFTAAQRQMDPEIIEPAIWGESVESGVSGAHPNVLVIDDLSNNRNSQTFAARTQITKKYKLNRKVLISTGIELKVGTIYGTGDLFTDEVLTSRPGSIRRVIQPAMKLKTGERLDPNGFPDEEDVELVFPSILGYDILRAEYESGFDSFMTQYMLDEYGSAEVVFSQDQMMASMIEEENLPLEGVTFIHWRLPCRNKEWKTATAAVGVLHRNRCYIVDTLQGHYKPSVLAKLIVTTAREHNLHKISLEDSPGARLMQPPIQNYALTTGWDLHLDWRDFEEDTGERDTRIRNIEALLATGRLYFNAGIKQLKPLMQEMTQYGMIPENGIPDCVARVADNLPQSIAAEDLENEDAAWKQVIERDKYNQIYFRGAYARPEAEPEEMVYEEPDPAEEPYNSLGLETIMPGLE